MQHDNKENGRGAVVRRFFAEKGYYFVLVACVAAIGVSGWLLYAALRESADTSSLLSTAAMAEQQTPDSAQDASGDRDDPENAATAVHPDKTGSPAQSAAPAEDTDAAVAETAEQIIVRPISGAATQPYAMDHLVYRATTQDWRTHDGVDLAAAEGTPVLAASAGTVRRVFEDDLLGTVVEVAHADGYLSRYANLAATPTVAEGDSVKAGDILGAVGTTAAIECADAPHLHFALSRDGASVDPEEWLP